MQCPLTSLSKRAFLLLKEIIKHKKREKFFMLLLSKTIHCTVHLIAQNVYWQNKLSANRAYHNPYWAYQIRYIVRERCVLCWCKQNMDMLRVQMFMLVATCDHSCYNLCSRFWKIKKASREREYKPGIWQKNCLRETLLLVLKIGKKSYMY